MARVRLSSMPDPHEIKSLRFPALNGGLNLRDAEINLRENESPEIINLWWNDGVLQSRPGQEWASASVTEDEESGESPVGYAVTTEPFFDYIFLHVGDQLFYFRPGDDALSDAEGLPRPRVLCTGVPKNRGTFFQFSDWLFYKNRGGFYQISKDSTAAFSVRSVDEDAYVPTILINANPAYGSGDLYQPENALSPKKRVTYNAAVTSEKVTLTAAGMPAVSIGYTASNDNLQGLESVYIGGNFIEPALYRFDAKTGVIIFDSAPEQGAVISVTMQIGTLTYRLPVDDIDSVDEVRVDGLLLDKDKDYSVDLSAGTVTFKEAPPVTNPPTNNTVEIVYSKADPVNFNAVMGCPYAAVYGSGQQLCIIAAGCSAQPNAVFWSGNSDVSLDPSYWPVPFYNLVGNSQDPVTGFGKQYDQLIVFKRRSIGKLELSFEDIDGRSSISLNYSGVNDKIGCDFPESVQLIQNNLVFATSGSAAEPGVYMIQSASAAYENNVVCVSGKVNGSVTRPGLAHDLLISRTANSYDDGRHYFLTVNDHVWVWDYSLSAPSNPVWFFFTDIYPVAWFTYSGTTYHLSAAGRVTKLGSTLSDYGEPIRKVYQFPVRSFGGYDRLKDVLTVILSVPADNPSDTALIYETDYETRSDRVKLQTSGYDRLGERDLSVRDLSVPRHAAVFRRRPMCRHVRHFTMRLENRTADCDLAILSAEIQYRFLGRDR